MSIIIPGMKMPTRCLDCPFMVSRDNDDCILQSAELNESFENWEQMKAGCPLIELPPHGDLIDRSKIVYTRDESGFRTMAYAHRAQLENITPVIPAEEE